MKLSGYIILVAWAAVMAAIVYSLYNVSRDARAEFFHMVYGPRPETQLAAAEGSPTAQTAAQDISPEVRADLSNRLQNLALALQTYQVNLANTAQAAN